MDNDFLHDLFAEFGAIEIKRMFSGRGIYARGVIFGIVSSDDAIHFKTDETTREAYARENTKPLTFTKKSGQRMVTSYWRLPERLYDDPGELAEWARAAARVAQDVTREKSTSKKKPATRKPATKSLKTVKPAKKVKGRKKVPAKARSRPVKRR
ncbi:TfoX/Sxy family protein [Undibacter mobilis]|uniref:Competence protein TfoX n=1 Tax=Undibacter mobilis TaxID=2292256 RepID=A0A371BDF2_9BRAD|nr:TfoX/Sxy family protein [Undibacter mobilis]RDV05578.1 competence protein TfoX [Undibacter mobilis]